MALTLTEANRMVQAAIAKAHAVCGDRIQEIPHRRIVGAITDEDEVKKTSRVVDKVRYNPSAAVSGSRRPKSAARAFGWFGARR